MPHSFTAVIASVDRYGKAASVTSLVTQIQVPYTMSESTIRALATTLSQQLQAHGGERYQLTYTGSGDSTDGCTVQVSPASCESALNEVVVEFPSETSTWKSGEWVTTSIQATRSFEDAAYALAEMLWNHAGQGGWYNNEGGYGDLIILPGGFVEFRHVNYLNNGYEYDEDDNEFEVDQEEDEACHWYFNVLVGPIDAPYQEPAPGAQPT